MKIKIKVTNISLSGSLSQYLEKRILPLEKFIKDFLPKEKDLENPIEERKGRVEFFVEIGKESAGSNKGLFFSKARIFIPGEKTIIAQTRDGDLRRAIDFLKDELYVQLSSIKKKSMAITERKVRSAKKDINLSPEARFYRKGRIRDESL
jgi:ribosome-associated translation inhibitor RaiA